MPISRRGFLGRLATGAGVALVGMRLSHAAPRMSVDFAAGDDEGVLIDWRQQPAESRGIYYAMCTRDAHGNQLTQWTAPVLVSRAGGDQ